MLSALFCGILGLASTFFIGTQVFGFPLTDLILYALVSMASGLFALFGILRAERTPWIRRMFLGRSLKTWPLFLILYFGPLFLAVPPVREPGVFLWLALPLILCTGFAILIFGPIQDRLVARRQRLSRART